MMPALRASSGPRTAVRFFETTFRTPLMAWMLIAIVCSLGFSATLRWSQHARGSMRVAASVNYIMAAGVYVVIFVTMRPDVDPAVIAIGAMTGVLYICNLFLFAAVMKRIGIVLTGAIMSLAVVVPVAVSIAFGDPWRDKAAGLVVALVALPILASARASHRGEPIAHGIRRWLWVTLLFFAAGMEGTLLKLASEVGDASYQWTFLPALFLTAAIISTPVMLRAPLRAATRWDVLRGALLGGCNVVANFAMTIALLQLPGPLLFPMRHVGGVMGTALLGWLLWHERLGRRAVIGLILCAVAAVLLTW